MNQETQERFGFWEENSFLHLPYLFLNQIIRNLSRRLALGLALPHVGSDKDSFIPIFFSDSYNEDLKISAVLPNISAGLPEKIIYDSIQSNLAKLPQFKWYFDIVGMNEKGAPNLVIEDFLKENSQDYWAEKIKIILFNKTRDQFGKPIVFSVNEKIQIGSYQKINGRIGFDPVTFEPIWEKDAYGRSLIKNIEAKYRDFFCAFVSIDAAELKKFLYSMGLLG